ncbi:MAG: hypothetical protein VXZ42_02240 [Actinomycetota bacterium]|jgi:hypothetical protein|nr:hypothetical protein [Actinomycetota bacterium]MED5382410.1 hypothetical protein [Actinomycetota bacterium]|tara:strand:+ start:347 stop:1201 length:855 start_codon:yes stop_codon:yes gene_type:complete
MKNKLQLQDFTFFINILKDSNKWKIDDLTKKLGKDIETIVYMLNIMSEVYSVNGENFIDFEIDSSENLIFFEYSSTFKELNTITDFELFKIYNLLKSNQNLNIQNINKKDYKNFSKILDMYFDEKSNIEFEDNLSIHLLTDINIEYLKIGYNDPKTYSIKPISISNNQDGNVLEAIDLIDNKVKTFLINRIIEVNELNLISSSNKEKINSIEVKFKYKNENFSNKLDKDNTFFKDGLCIYTFRDFNVALEFFFEHFQELQIVSPNKLKIEFNKRINNLVDMINL